MSTHRRLSRLEQTVGDAGCPACRQRRGLIVLVDARGQADGTVPHPKGQPDPCSRCGVVPEFVIEIAEAVFQSREELP